VDILVEAGATIYPPMKEELEELAQLSDVNRLGRTVLSLFSCANYISAVHGDADMSAADLRAGRSIKKALGTLYPCVQLAKSGCSSNSYNFAYVKYGVVVQTQANTVWYVSQSSICAAVHMTPGTSMVAKSMVPLCQVITRS
jgi:hypothetical protein